MRSVGYMGRIVLVVVMLLASSAVFGTPREDRRDRDKPNPILRLVKKVIKSLGDGLVTPTP